MPSPLNILIDLGQKIPAKLQLPSGKGQITVATQRKSQIANRGHERTRGQSKRKSAPIGNDARVMQHVFQDGMLETVK